MILIAVSAVVVTLTGGYAVSAFVRYQEHTAGNSAVATAPLAEGPKILFRNTAAGQGYGHVASVPLGNPSGDRTLTPLTCDRVDMNAGLISCLQIVRGIPPSYRTELVDGSMREQENWPLPGIPSRTRISDYGLIATTSFVTGHSYASSGFSTETTIHDVDGRSYGNLENFEILIGEQKLTAVDRNVWGVTFGNGGEFYATVASGAQTWLVEGDLENRTLTAIVVNAECPSLSPDGTKVAYKKRRPGGATVHWDAAFLDLESQKETVIPVETGFDDQLEWLDNKTLLYGLPRAGSVGDSDIYQLEATAGALPELLIEHAWSPSVQR